MWGCRGHWFALPKDIRAEIWKQYRPGQETDKLPSKEYVDIAMKAVAFGIKYEQKRKMMIALQEPDSHGTIFFERRDKLALYQDAINELVAEKLATTEFIDMPEEQYAKLNLHITDLGRQKRYRNG